MKMHYKKNSHQYLQFGKVPEKKYLIIFMNKQTVLNEYGIIKDLISP